MMKTVSLVNQSNKEKSLSKPLRWIKAMLVIQYPYDTFWCRKDTSIARCNAHFPAILFQVFLDDRGEQY